MFFAFLSNTILKRPISTGFKFDISPVSSIHNNRLLNLSFQFRHATNIAAEEQRI